MIIAKIKKYNSFTLSFGLFYLVQNLTIGQITFLKQSYLYGPIFTKEIIFVLTSIILNFIVFNWRKN
jgi:hypothetical protein